MTQSLRELNFHIEKGHGDSIQALHFLTKLCEKNPTIKCNIYINAEHKKQLNELVVGTNVCIVDQIYPDSIGIWGGELLHHVQAKDPENYPIFCKEPNNVHLESYFALCYEMDNTFIEMVYPDLNKAFQNYYELLLDEDMFKKDIVEEKFDYLIINSHPVSSIMKISASEQDAEFLKLCNHLVSKGKKIITTLKIEGFPSTQDYNMLLTDIGKLSKNCKFIVGIPTSPFLICVNKLSFNSVEKFIIYSNIEATLELDSKFYTVDSMEKLMNLDEIRCDE